MNKRTGKKARSGSPSTKKQPWRIVTENLECLAIAGIVALILNQFFIQAYKIPTGSMQPTIIGDADQGIFDRILVNKFLYLFDEPERWDIVVFKYPLDQSQNYIKRLIGLPGESIEIRGGDIFVDGKIERKPESVTRAVLKRIYPPLNGEDTYHRFFESGEHCRVEGDRVVLSEPETVSTRHPIRDRYLDGYDPAYGITTPRHVKEDCFVGDMRLSFTARLDNEDGAIKVEIEEGGRIHRFYLSGMGANEPSHLSTGMIANEQGLVCVWENPELRLEAGRNYDLTFSHIDDRLSLKVDGEEVAAYDYVDSDLAGDRIASRVHFGTERCGATLAGITLSRDIHYLPGNGKEGPVRFQVPQDHYFALGDNTQNSVDGRKWTATVCRTKDGREIRGDLNQADQQDPRRARAIVMNDVQGDPWLIPFNEIQPSGVTAEPVPFIPDRLMLGKAMVIWWPIFTHFRWKLLR